MRISNLRHTLSTLLVVLLVSSCQIEKRRSYDEELEKELSVSLGVKLNITKLLWEDCYRLDLDLLKDREEFIKDPEALFLYTYDLARKGFSHDRVCQVFFYIGDAEGLWFVGSILRKNFLETTKSAYSFYELSFSEDLKEQACEFFRKNVKEKAFLVCTKHTELKKLFSND